MLDALSLPPRADHRSFNGERRREQTRARILEAARSLCQSRRHGPPALDDLATLARVSRSTLYNHFHSIDETLAALGEDLTRRHALRLEQRYAGVTQEPRHLQALCLRATLAQAVREPVWARLMVRTAAWTRTGSFSTALLGLLVDGRERGEFRFIDERVALDQLQGLLARSFVSLHEGASDPARYIDGAVQAVLQGLGCGPSGCEDGLRFSKRLLAGNTPAS